VREIVDRLVLEQLEDLRAERWSPLTSQSFARDWESAEDAVYDAVPAR
jgi:hypothetical protein